MSSRLAFAPERVNASFATSKMRSRFRCASVRGFRGAILCFFSGIKKVATGDSLRLSYIQIRRPSPFYPEPAGLSIALTRFGGSDFRFHEEEYGCTQC